MLRGFALALVSEYTSSIISRLPCTSASSSSHHTRVLLLIFLVLMRAATLSKVSSFEGDDQCECLVQSIADSKGPLGNVIHVLA